MKQRFIEALVVGLALIQLGCGGCGGGPAQVFDAPTPIDIADEQQGDRPRLWLSVHDRTRLTLSRDLPWLVSARVQHPAALGGEVSAPVSVAAGEEAFVLRLTNDQGQAITAAFERLGSPLAAPLTLDPDAEVVLRWRLPGTEAATLSPGTYQLTLALEAGALSAQSPPVTLSLTLTPDGSVPEEAPLLRADDAIARGAFSEAESEIDALLLEHPEHVRGLTRKGLLREAAGDPGAAHASYRTALSAAVKEAPNAPEGGPRHLYWKVEALRAAADGGSY